MERGKERFEGERSCELMMMEEVVCVEKIRDDEGGVVVHEAMVVVKLGNGVW